MFWYMLIVHLLFTVHWHLSAIWEELVFVADDASENIWTWKYPSHPASKGCAMSCCFFLLAFLKDTWFGARVVILAIDSHDQVPCDMAEPCVFSSRISRRPWDSKPVMIKWSAMFFSSEFHSWLVGWGLKIICSTIPGDGYLIGQYYWDGATHHQAVRMFLRLFLFLQSAKLTRKRIIHHLSLLYLLKMLFINFSVSLTEGKLVYSQGNN